MIPPRPNGSMITPMPHRDADASNSSTYETSTFSKKRTALTAEIDAPAPAVRFDEYASVSYRNHQICQEDCAELWYAKEDYQRFKKSHTGNAKDIIRVESKYRGPNSYINVLTRVFDACINNNTEQDDDAVISLASQDARNFQKWVSVTESRVGLERLAARKIRMDKAVRRKEIVFTVLDLQEDPSISTEPLEVTIAKAACEISRPSRNFAALLAHAQQQASR
mmetsp:Transcript_11222/g.22952  ORF Transcript_11222/g.22952 Transcript_11222/m.22952 type:complete len:223 (-) Transcript_11222:135-803(-)|eukprot:CAMPEP_0172455190 /NCGR_PEP_ID=MMETSP1065-20121228/11939_1 /TAXON_ID=265537 /ORGANISM="Amphiprora paludosa, Strain CCMP125" /LENGTH=222 /DNA_ID=CAMNT_0013207647 /DNA_START=198 /DNA_END=866 /DNA_ORIENTATION=-